MLNKSPYGWSDMRLARIIHHFANMYMLEILRSGTVTDSTSKIALSSKPLR
jgi:hypothetical protein